MPMYKRQFASKIPCIATMKGEDGLSRDSRLNQMMRLDFELSGIPSKCPLARGGWNEAIHHMPNAQS
jgi:hypothetical protein